METDIQTVVISGYGDFEYARQCLSYGVKEYLLKPVSKGNLQNVIGKLEAHREKLESFVSVAKLDEWVVRMDDAIWTLDKERLYLVLKEWETDFLQRKMSRSQQKELLEEGYALLVKKLLVNSVTPGKSVLDLSAAAGPEQLFRCFAEASAAILEELRRKRKGKAKDPIEEAKAFIEKHLAQEVSLEEVAEVLGLNASYFSQMFKHSTGETFVHYRIKRRMEKAKDCLPMQAIGSPIFPMRSGMQTILILRKRSKSSPGWLLPSIATSWGSIDEKESVEQAVRLFSDRHSSILVHGWIYLLFSGFG